MCCRGLLSLVLNFTAFGPGLPSFFRPPIPSMGTSLYFPSPTHKKTYILGSLKGHYDPLLPSRTFGNSDHFGSNGSVQECTRQ